MNSKLHQAKEWIWAWDKGFASRLELVPFLDWDEVITAADRIEGSETAEHLGDAAAAYVVAENHGVPYMRGIALRKELPDAFRLAMTLVHEGWHAVEHAEGIYTTKDAQDPDATIAVENRAYTAQARFAEWFMTTQDKPDDVHHETVCLAAHLRATLARKGHVEVADLGFEVEYKREAELNSKATRRYNERLEQDAQDRKSGT